MNRKTGCDCVQVASPLSLNAFVITLLEGQRMKTYVVNLRRRPDRRRRMQDVLPRELNAEFTTDWKGSLDSKDITRETLGRLGFDLFPWQISSDNMWWSRPLKKGEIGCTISHWLCWHRAIEEKDDLFMILEDDVSFVTDFVNRLKIGLNQLKDHNPCWDLLYLGRFHLFPDEPACEGIVRPGYSHCTFAYIITRSCATKLLSAELEKAIIPVDEFLPAMYINHPREDVRKRYPPRLSAYAFEPEIVFQLPKSVAGSDTEDSDFVDW